MARFALVPLFVAAALAVNLRAEERAYRTRVDPHWNADCSAFWYRNDLAGGVREYVLVDAVKGTRTAIPSAPRNWVEAVVSNRPPRMRSSRVNGPESSMLFSNATTRRVRIDWIDAGGRATEFAQLASGATETVHTFAGHVWRATDDRGRILGHYEARDDTMDIVVGGTPAPVVPPADSAVAHPDRVRARVRDGTVWLDGRAVTSNGVPGDAYEGPVHWAPDGSRFVVMKRRAGGDRQLTLVESSPADQLQPRVRTVPYLKPGDPIAQSFPHLFDAVTGREIPIDGTLFSNPWNSDRLAWEPDSSAFSFVYNQRGHQALRVVAVNAKTGIATAVVDETSPTFIDYAQKFFFERLPATGELIWMSERSGWNHLYLIDARSGRVKNPITKGEWVVRGVDRVDPEKRQVWFRAGGIRPGEDPYYVHVCRVNFDGSGLTVLTDGDGTHTVAFSPDGRWLIDRWSRVDLPPVNALRRTSDGALVCALEQGDDAALRATGWRPPERFVAKATDGVTDLFGIIHWPRRVESGRKYPVLEDIYAGPQDSFVPKAYATFHGPQELCARGFIVVQVDAPGTSNRSKKFHDVCWKNVAEAGLSDRIAWIKAAAEKHPEFDLGRVGIYGGSAGGQSALRALLFHGDFYKAGAADCGCHDNRMDKIWWNELWMGWPVDKAYEEQSNVAHADRLQGKLFLSVGELDDNVDPSSTMQVVAKLTEANKDFELLIQPGKGHGSGETAYGRRRRAEFFERALK